MYNEFQSAPQRVRNNFKRYHVGRPVTANQQKPLDKNQRGEYVRTDARTQSATQNKKNGPLGLVNYSELRDSLNTQ